MSRKLASVVRIATCDPIPDTDKLSVATMEGKGWKVVTGRDEYKAGDLAVYFEIDSYLPVDDDRYAFLKERCLRKFMSKSGTLLKQGLKIKTIKLRGVVSQGLLIPMSAYPELSGKFNVGDDLTEVLNVEHYDEVKDALAPQTGVSIPFDSYGQFPSEFIPKTDEERIQNLGDYFTKMKGRTFEITAKFDSSSCTMIYAPKTFPDRPFRVCSRNQDLKPNGCPMWSIAEKQMVKEALLSMYEDTGHEFALQGELVGPGVNSNRDMYTEHDWYVFRIWDITDQKFVEPDERRSMCHDYGIKHVQVIGTHVDVFDKFLTEEDLLKFAEGKTERGHEREGLVFKADDGKEPFVSFKAVSNRYLLKLCD